MVALSSVVYVLVMVAGISSLAMEWLSTTRMEIPSDDRFLLGVTSFLLEDSVSCVDVDAGSRFLIVKREQVWSVSNQLAKLVVRRKASQETENTFTNRLGHRPNYSLWTCSR